MVYTGLITLKVLSLFIHEKNPNTWFIITVYPGLFKLLILDIQLWTLNQ